MQRCALVVAHASVLTDGLRAHATVVFPAESYAEKEGTVVHPDGRVQRLRAAIGHPGEIRPGWGVLAELSRRVGLDTGVLSSAMAFAQLVEAVPFYGGLTLDELGGHGARWPEREQGEAMGDEQRPPQPAAQTAPEAVMPAAVAADTGAFEGEPGEDRAAPGDAGPLRLGTYRPLWAAPEVESSPALHFTIAHQQLELSPEDARRLGVSSGQMVDVSQYGTTLRAKAVVRSGVSPGSAFLAEGIAVDSANALTDGEIEVGRS